MLRYIALIALAVAALALASPVAADPPPTNANRITVTLTCANGTFTGVSIGHNNAVVFQIEGEMFVAITQQIWFTAPDGTTVVVRSAPPGQAAKDLVECTYDYPGFPFNPVHALVQFAAPSAA